MFILCLAFLRISSIFFFLTNLEVYVRFLQSSRAHCTIINWSRVRVSGNKNLYAGIDVNLPTCLVTLFLSAVKAQRSVLVFLNGTKFSHLQSRMEDQRGTPSPHLFICIYLLVVWIFSSQEGNRNGFKEKREREREREIEVQQSGLNLDCELIPSPISLWFPKSLTCNFPSVNLLKSPLMFLHLSLFLSIVFIDMHVNFSETQLGAITRGAAMSHCKTIQSIISEVKTWVCWVACSDNREWVH